MKGKDRKKRIIGLLGMLFLFCFGLMTVGTEALAASAVVSLTTGEEEVKKGDCFSVMVTVESADKIGNVELFVSFDSSCVSFIDTGKYTIGGDGLVLISDWDASGNSTRKKYALEFKAKKAGTCRFAVGDQPAVLLADSKEEMSVSSVNMSVTVMKKNAVKEEEETIQEVVVTENPVEGNEEEIQVDTDLEAEIESESFYEKEDEEITADVLEKEPEYGIRTIKQDKETIITQYTKLTVKKLKDESLVPEGYMKSNIRLDGESVIVYIPKEDISSEIYLIYAADGDGNTGFYEYNRVEGTIKPYTLYFEENVTDASEEIVNANFQMMTAIFVLMIICAILSVALVLTLRKLKRKPEMIRDEFFEEYYKYK